MPPIVAFFAAIVAFAGTAFGSIVVGLGISLAIGQVSKLFLKRHAVANVSQNESGITVRQPVSPRKVLYGRNHVGGIITYIDTASLGGATNDFLHLVITLSGHEVNAITAMYFDGVQVFVDGSGEAIDSFAGFVRVKYNLGTRSQQAFPDLVAESDGRWTVLHRQRSCAGAYVRLKYNVDKFPNGLPNITFDIEGKKVYDPRTGTFAYSDNAALCIADYLESTAFTQGLRYDPQSQEAIFPDDMGFNFVPTIQELNLTWGGKAIPQSNSGGGAPDYSNLDPYGY